MVTVQLQQYTDGSWSDAGQVGQETVRSGGGSANRATGRACCNSSATTSWRSIVDVDLVGIIDDPFTRTTDPRQIPCRPELTANHRERAMPNGTMLGVLHGDLEVHPWYDPDEALADPYSLFYARSSASRWLSDAMGGASGEGLWYMNDAGPAPVRKGTRRLWFQVELNSAVSADRTVPTQPFLTCAGAVASRLGRLELSAVQILMPLQELTGPPDHGRRAEMDLLQEAQWFADTVPGLASDVHLTLESGQNPSVDSAASSMVAWMRGLKQSVFTRIGPASHGEAPDGFESGIADHMWDGPARHRAALRGTLAEWSYAGLGWLSAFVAEASVQHGIRTTVLLTIRRL